MQEFLPAKKLRTLLLAPPREGELASEATLRECYLVYKLVCDIPLSARFRAPLSPPRGQQVFPLGAPYEGELSRAFA